MTFDDLPKFQVERIETDHENAVVRGGFAGDIQTQGSWIACLYLGGGRFLWGRFSEVNQQARSGVFVSELNDSSKVELGRAYPYLDAYWGERAELVFDDSRAWCRAAFHPRDSIRGNEVIPGGWDHEHCGICWQKIAEYAQPFGLRDQDDNWLCEECYVRYVVPKSIDFISAA
jgi:hypothetical protein